MRRKDREITDREEILAIIRKCDVCRIALNDGDYPYIVPLNFGLDVQGDQVFFYFHAATEGKKLDLIAKDHRATFEMDCDHNFILYEERMSCTMGYASVIGHGTIETVPDGRGNSKPNTQKTLAHLLKMAVLRYCPAYQYSLLAYRL